MRRFRGTSLRHPTRRVTAGGPADRADRERGAGALGYLAVALLVSATSTALFTTGVPGQVAAACKEAVCRVAGEGCPARQKAPQSASPGGQGLQGGRPGDGGPAEAAPPGTSAPSGAAGSPPRAPIPKPVCVPQPDTAWTERLHAHNDYQNQNPLTDSLNSGATSVEADIWVDKNGKVDIKHISSENPSEGELRDTYIKPLIERAKKNGGRIYKGRAEPFELIVEVKHGEGDVYQSFLKQIEGLPPNVRVLIGAGTKGAALGEKPPNVDFYDSLGDDCELPPAVDPASPEYDRAYAEKIVMLNGDFSSCADRNDDHRISDAEQRDFDAIVEKAHAAGQKVRIWGAPDGTIRVPGDDGGFLPCHGQLWPGRQFCEGGAQRDAWRSQLKAGVDYVATNHLGQARDFLRDCGR